jgi:hypothetical protein
MGGKRKEFDWEGIEREYRTGQLSVSEISRQYLISRAAIQKRAKAKGWSRDLSQVVREEVRARLLIDGTDGDQNAKVRPLAEEASIDMAARRGVKVVREHRKLIAEIITQVQLVVQFLAAGGHTDQNGVFTPLTPRERTDYVRVAAQAAHRMIPLERQAFSLDEPGSLDGPDSIKISFNREGHLPNTSSAQPRLIS